MGKVIRIGTRESQLAVWQATTVKNLLETKGYEAELVFIKSEGDIDLKTPLYEMGVQGVFTKTLDTALINNHIDIAVHSMKDVPTQLAEGIIQAAVLPRASYKDIFVYKQPLVVSNWQLDKVLTEPLPIAGTIATSSIRRRAQWLHRYPNHNIEVMRGNVNTRLQKVQDNNWDGAIFAGAGLERINLRPENSIDLDWMLPAPAQGAIMIVCSDEDDRCLEACMKLNDAETALCTKIERDFLRTLLGGCSTPISALAEVKDGEVFFQGNILSPDGKEKFELSRTAAVLGSEQLGIEAAKDLLQQGAQKITDALRNGSK